MFPWFWPGDELEYLRPNVYRNVARQLNIPVASESVVSDAFLAVAADIFSTGMSGAHEAGPACRCASWELTGWSPPTPTPTSIKQLLKTEEDACPLFRKSL